MELSRAAIELVKHVCNRPTLNFIQINQTDVVNELVRIASENSSSTVRVETVEYLKYVPRAKRNCNVFIIASASDFNQIYDIINPQLFNYLKNFLFVSLSHLPPSQSEHIFQLLWQKSILNANIVQLETRQVVSVTTFYPFKAHACNDTKPVVVNYFENGRFTKELKNVDKLSDLQQCPIKIVTATQAEPYVIIKNISDKDQLKGRDIKLVKLLSKLLNFRAEFIVLEDKGFIFENGSSGGLFKFLANKSADIAVNDLWLTSVRKYFFDTTTPYAYDDLIFVIPAMRELGPLQKFIYPFSTDTWVVLVGCIIIACMVIMITKLQSEKIQNFVFGKNVKNQFLNVWIGLLGMTQKPLPGRNFARFILMNFLLLSLVVRTAYQGAMYQFMKDDFKQKEPQTMDDLLRLNYNFYVLAINMDLFRHFDYLQKSIIEVTSKKREEGLKSTHDPSFRSVIAISKNMVVYRNQKNVGKKQLKICKERLLSIPTVIYVPKNFFLVNALNNKIVEIKAAGLIEFWLSEDVDEKFKGIKESKPPKKLNLDHLCGCFYMLAIGYVVSFVVFLGEILWRKVCAKKSKKKWKVFGYLE